MSVRGMGTDWVGLDRLRALLEGHGGRFLERCFRPEDIARSRTDARASDRMAIVGVSWAAKEAFLKALGADVSLLPYRDIALVDGADGWPQLQLHGMAREAWRRTGAREPQVSVAATDSRAQAWVVLED